MMTINVIILFITVFVSVYNLPSLAYLESVAALRRRVKYTRGVTFLFLGVATDQTERARRAQNGSKTRIRVR